MSTHKSEKAYKLAIIGGGAAGFFAAANLPSNFGPVTILEGTGKLLSKVEISGGGRCNVTHGCFDPKTLIERYPRGGRELRGPFNRFQPEDTMRWFAERGVALKVEKDGRVFPVTDSSRSIMECLLREAEQNRVEVQTRVRVISVWRDGVEFLLRTKEGLELRAENVLIATGSSNWGHELARAFGHTVTPLAPSLFTFTLSDPIVQGLSGISFPAARAELSTPSGELFRESGPLLITHWGVSGPVVLRLSAWAARELLSSGYKATLTLSWVSESAEQIAERLRELRVKHPKKLVRSLSPVPLSTRFWERLCESLPEGLTYAELSNAASQQVVRKLTQTQLQILGKGEFKEEFVTCGGVSLNEINFQSFESRIVPGLFFAGEILDIDGITGGYNFQAAWTGGFHVAARLRSLSGV